MSAAALTAIEAGCAGITVHPRPDLRHIRPDDVLELARLARARVEFNIEGNPFAPARGQYPGLLALVAAARPEQVTLVPDGDGQLTSDHGFDLRRDAAALRPIIAELKACGARVSLFMDAGAETSNWRPRLAPTGSSFTPVHSPKRLPPATPARLWRAAPPRRPQARALGLGVNAGHDLSQANLGAFLRGVPGVAEVSIGHALIWRGALRRTSGNRAPYLGDPRAPDKKKRRPKAAFLLRVRRSYWPLLARRRS